VNPFGWLKRNRPGAVPFKKSETEAMLSLVNPLSGMTERGLQAVFDTARRGCYARLQWIYNEIEAADPTLLTVAERRESAAGDCDFRITSPDGRRVDGFDEALAAEQREALEGAYGRVERGLPALAEHLCGARFRGFAHARPLFDGPRLAGFEHLDQWNFCRDTLTGRWWWNPSASDGAPDAVEIPPGELVSLCAKRHIDYPAMAIYIRLALGERKYGVWLERYGIPPVTIIMPEFADTADQDKYFEAADRMSRAGGGALPYGSQVNYANEARGANPFDAFIRHQQELIVIAATGGTLTTLASPTGIGGGASGAQENVWRSIVRRDVRAAGDAIDAALTARILAPLFPGKPALARFEFATEERPTAAAVFEEAAKARSAGYTVDMAELSEETGWTLAPYEAAPAAAAAAPVQTALNKAGGESPAADPAAAALAADLKPLSDRLAAALDLPDDEMLAELEAIRKAAPDLFRRMDDSGLFTAELEEKLARAFAAGFKESAP
jgi:hypothetical protein